MTALFRCRSTCWLALSLAIATPAGGEPILPTEVGTTWQYDRTEQVGASAERTSATLRIAGAEDFDGKQLLKFESAIANEQTKTELVSVEDAGVFCFRRTLPDGQTVSFDPPQPIVQAPLQVGAKWTFVDKVAGAETRQEFVVVGEEQLAVPAGKFRAFRVRCEQPWPVSIAIERWFTPGTGLIKEITTSRGPGGRLLSRSTIVLRKLSVVAESPRPASAAPSVDINTATPAEPSPAPSPSVTLEVAGDREGPLQTEFQSDVEKIFVRWTGRDLPSGARVRIVWVAEDVGDIAPPNFIVDETSSIVTMPELSARFTLSRPMDGWAAGKYRVEIYIDDKLVQAVKVSIRD